MYNGILVIDKPEGMTSHSVVGRIRRIMGQKKVGHGGTLDPMATGVLPVFAGRSTRAASFSQTGGKTYLARMRLGIVTDTQDTTGTVLEQSDVSCSEAGVKAAMGRFMGDIEQIPPMYSAVSVGGVRLYKLARQGVEVERAPREVNIAKIELTGTLPDSEYEFRVDCSKGLYVRTLINDIGRELGCGAAMSALRRERAGIFNLDRAITLERAEELAEKGELEKTLFCPDIFFMPYPSVTLSPQEEAKVLNGVSIEYNGDGIVRIYNDTGAFLGPGQISQGLLKLTKTFY